MTFSANLLTAFSIIRNSKLLTKEDSSSASSIFSSQRFSCLDNMCLIVTLLAILIHHYFIPVLYLVNNKGQYKHEDLFPWIYISKSKWYIFTSPIFADINFMISGIITSYIMLTRLERKKTFHYFSYLLTRYLRLLAPLIGSILVFYLLPIVGDGPLWEPGMQFWFDPCKYENKLIQTLTMRNNFGVDFTKGFTVS
jgi:peptidoglycan/LPS O-acetylase OafA/YrhL